MAWLLFGVSTTQQPGNSRACHHHQQPLHKCASPVSMLRTCRTFRLCSLHAAQQLYGPAASIGTTTALSHSHNAACRSLSTLHADNEVAGSDTMSTMQAATAKAAAFGDEVTFPVRRRWLHASNAAHAATKPSNTFSFTIMSYNILAQALIRRDQFPYCSKQSLKLQHRRDNLLKEILDINADVCCFQEMDDDLYNKIYKRRLQQAGYTTSFGKGQTKHGDDAKHGLCIAWKSDKFEKVDEELIEFSELATPYLQQPDASSATSNGTAETVTTPSPALPTAGGASDPTSVYNELYRPNIAMIVALRLTSPNSQNCGLIVSTNHLFWHPRYSFVRLMQCHRLLQGLHAMHQRHPTFCTLATGDFNSTPEYVEYRYLTRHQVSPEHIECLHTHPAHGQPRTVERFTGLPIIPVPEPLISSSNTAESRQRRIEEIDDLVRSSSALPQLQSAYSHYTDVATAADPNLSNTTSNASDADYSLWRGEPKYTNFTEKFRGCLDYIMTAKPHATSVSNQNYAKTAAAAVNGESSDSNTQQHAPPMKSNACCPSLDSCKANVFTPHSSLATTAQLQCTAILEMPSEDALSVQVALPNESFSSDHISIAAKFDLIMR